MDARTGGKLIFHSEGPPPKSKNREDSPPTSSELAAGKYDLGVGCDEDIIYKIEVT